MGVQVFPEKEKIRRNYKYFGPKNSPETLMHEPQDFKGVVSAFVVGDGVVVFPSATRVLKESVAGINLVVHIAFHKCGLEKKNSIG